MALDEKAIEAVQKWRFKSAMKDGAPIATPANRRGDFRLLDKAAGSIAATFAPRAAATACAAGLSFKVNHVRGSDDLYPVCQQWLACSHCLNGLQSGLQRAWDDRDNLQILEWFHPDRCFTLNRTVPWMRACFARGGYGGLDLVD